jgi:hypothetical protein
VIAGLATVAVGMGAPLLCWRLFPHTWGDPLVSAALADLGLLAGLLVDLWVGDGGRS